MANISVVDYQQMPGKANQIQQIGVQMNNEFTSIWDSVNNLRGTWHGLRYNSLISYFNRATDSVNAILKMVIVEIPWALGQAAINYAKPEGVTVAAVPAGSVAAIQTLTDSDTSTMAYNSGEAANVQQSASAKFGNIENLMNDIETTFSSIVWESDAKQAFQQRFTTLKGQIVDAVSTINTQFVNLMQASQADIEGAEAANTVE